MLRFLINTQTGKPAVPARPPKALPPTKQKPFEAAPKRKPTDAEERPRKKKARPKSPSPEPEPEPK